MTVTTTINQNLYNADGSTDTFAYGFKITSADDLDVYVNADGTGLVQRTLDGANPYDYTVTGVGNPTGGDVVFNSPPPVRTSGVLLYREVQIDQESDYVNGDGFNQEVLESDLDRIVMILQQLDEKIGRALITEVGSPYLYALPVPVGGKILGWNAAGTQLENKDLAAGASTTTNYISVKDFGATGDGTTDDTDAIQLALDNSLQVFFPVGDYKVTSSLVLRAGHSLLGVNRQSSRLMKSNFSGACLLGNDTHRVTIQELGIVGPGRTTGSGNKGIEIKWVAASGGIVESISLVNLAVEELNDVGIYLGTCSYVQWTNVRARNIGYACFWIDGGDGHVLLSCTTRYAQIGYLINKPAGYGPTTVACLGCYAEQHGIGFRLNGAVSCSLIACGVEAAINFDPATPGRNYWITGGRNVNITGCLSRNDTIGAAISEPHILIDGSAANVVIVGFARENSGTYTPPTWEIDAINATSVYMLATEWTGGTIRSSGKIYTLNVTAIP